MVARRFEELDAWQLSVELRDAILDLLESRLADRSLCDEDRAVIGDVRLKLRRLTREHRPATAGGGCDADPR